MTWFQNRRAKLMKENRERGIIELMKDDFCDPFWPQMTHRISREVTASPIASMDVLGEISYVGRIISVFLSP
jgi:hypothetical protein